MKIISITARKNAAQRDVSWIFPEKVRHGRNEARFMTACILTSPDYASSIYSMLTEVTLRDRKIMDYCYRITPEMACATLKEIVAEMGIENDDFKIETFPLDK